MNMLVWRGIALKCYLFDWLMMMLAVLVVVVVFLVPARELV
jgi:hypothetical protein